MRLKLCLLTTHYKLTSGQIHTTSSGQNLFTLRFRFQDSNISETLEKVKITKECV